MKAKYEAPKMIQVALQTRLLISVSETTQNVYTDDPQDVGNALIKETTFGSIWDDEW